MKYISTRNSSEAFNFSDIVISGVAKDGGLFVPTNLPKINEKTISSWKNLTYQELAAEIISLFTTDIEKSDIKKCCQIAYEKFDNEVLHLKELKQNQYLLELFHGPTLSFKDYALSFLGQAVDLVLSKNRQKKHIITATSGDTGPAAINGFLNCKWVDIEVLYPKNGVSKFQENQMQSIKKHNVVVRAMDLSFDECQDVVKKIFLSQDSDNLMTVNSVNIGRIIAQIVYYFWLYLNLGKCDVFVPTGNFGNIFAGFLAKKLGADINLNICVNENDTLFRFYQSGIYQPKKVIQTNSNAIDISNPSNFERILWYLSNDKNDVKKYMKSLKENGSYNVSDEFLDKFKNIFKVFKTCEDDVKQTQDKIFNKYKIKICPHTALALKCSEKNTGKSVIFSTASWVKFS